jgi:hypothetical protein
VANAFYRKQDLESALAAVKIKQADAEIPEAVALAVHDLWVSLLSDIRSNEKLTEPYILSPQVILYAKIAGGKILRGKMPPASFRYKNLASVEDIVDDLMKICIEPGNARQERFSDIKQKASALARRR